MNLNDFVNRASQAIFEHEAPLKYIRTRGLSDDDIRKFLIGYLRVVKLRKEESEDYKTLYERTYGFKSLQNRIIFPLRNVLGTVHGLCTRDIEHKRYTQYFLEEAKNIGTFFGLYEALPHIRKTRKVFVHEGAFDSVSFSRVFPNTVSSLTSFLNEQQYEQLRFYADKIILVYDRDSAGNSGIKKSFEYYGEKHLDRIYLGADDSNSYLQRLGPERFEMYVRSKVPILLQN
jgi:DNA primase